MMTVLLSCILMIMLVTEMLDFPRLKRGGFPIYLIPGIISTSGFGMLAVAKIPTTRWRSLAVQSLVASSLWLYLIPIVEWWTGANYSAWLTLNLGAFAVVCVWLLVLVHRLCAESARFRGDRAQRQEYEIGAWISAFLMSIPIMIALARLLPPLLSENRLAYDSLTPIFGSRLFGAMFLLPLAMALLSLFKSSVQLKRFGKRLREHRVHSST